jgi:uncharacterized protein YidB (DUF937 family)
MDTQKLRTGALWWARRGFPVFPLIPKDKRPLGALVPHGFKDATKEPSQIEKWWRAQPMANIGLAIPEKVFVVDLDGEAAGNAWINMCGRNGEPSNTLTVITNRGRHLYFRSNVEVNNSTGRIGAHIDVRGDGGYSVAPPSVHPSGSIYALDKSAGIEIADAPQWLVDLALPDNDPRDVEILPPVRRDNGPATLRAVEGILGAVATARTGERNSLTYWAARRMSERIAAGQLGATLAQELLVEAACRAGLSQREASLTIKSAMRGDAHG